MAMIARTSLASLVCPSAPFLAPRLLRTPAPLAALQSPCLQSPQGRRPKTLWTKKRKSSAPKEGIPRKSPFEEPRAGSVLDRLHKLRNACDQRDIRTIMDVYPSLVPTGALAPHDPRRIAQALHACVRNQHVSSTRISDTFPFIQHLVEDLQAGRLPPHPYAFVHILGIYKECAMFDQGYALWQWLVDQDDTFVSQAVYGAAIELLAYGNKLRLPELENIYADALKRFPGTFAEYHLSPDAIVPDRSQPIVIPDVPVLLLQGILTARIRMRDWKNSYLALDTALRLYPSHTPTRFFDLFMTERPLEEAYTVYLVACRGGTVVKPSHLTSLITRIRSAQQATNSLRDRTTFLRATANAIYAYLEAGGTLEPVHVGQFLNSFDTLLPELEVGAVYEGQMRAIRNSISTFAHGVLSTLLQAGMPPSSHVFLAMVHLAGKLHVPDLLNASLQDIRTAQVELDEIGCRRVINSAGQLKNIEVIEEYWTRIASRAESEGRQIDFKDWVALAKACKRTDHLDYFRKQLSHHEHAIPANSKDAIIATVDHEFTHVTRQVRLLSKREFTAELDKLEQQMKNVAAVVMSGQRLDIRNSPFYMFLDPERPPLGSLHNMRTIYNEYTIDPHQPPAPAGASRPALSPTGIPLDELRFANWVSVMELMEQADSNNEERRRLLGFKEREGKMHPHRMTEVVRLRRNRNDPAPLPLPALRQAIQRLRDRNAPDRLSRPALRQAIENLREDTSSTETSILNLLSSNVVAPPEPSSESSTAQPTVSRRPLEQNDEPEENAPMNQLRLKYFLRPPGEHESPAVRMPLGPAPKPQHPLRLLPERRPNTVSETPAPTTSDL